MTVKAFGPVLVVDDLGVPIGATVGAFTDPDTGIAIPALGLDGVTPVTVATSPRGVTGQWMLDVPAAGYVFATFGTMGLALAPLGADPVAGLPVGGTTGQALVKASGADGDVVWQTVAGGSGSAPDATSSTKGIVQLAGDLAGTAASPTVPGLATKVPTSRTINAKPLSANITLTAADVGALPDTYNYVPAWSDITGKPANFPPSAHTHPASDLTATGTRDATTFLRGDNTWAAPAGGGGGEGLLVAPPVGWFFSSPLLYNGTTNKPSNFLAPHRVPGYGGVVTVNELSVWVDTADAAGGPVTVTIKAAGADGLSTATVLATSTHATTATGRVAAAVTPFTIPATGAWVYISTFTGTARLRVANAMMLAANMGNLSTQSGALGGINDDPNNNAGNPCIVTLRRSA